MICKSKYTDNRMVTELVFKMDNVDPKKIVEAYQAFSEDFMHTLSEYRRSGKL